MHRYVELFAGELGGPGAKQFSGSVADVARQELEFIEGLRTVDLNAENGTLKVVEDNAEAKLTKETNLTALMGMKEVFTGLRRRWQNEHQIDLILHPHKKQFEVKKVLLLPLV